ncbi:MAG: peptidase domain-containing ABC transporter [Treponema sp.]|nr:peptidase domain-containing ABC transporter [Treponema sp.]
MKLTKIPFVKQLDEADCAAACISMLAKYYGKRISVTKIRTSAGTDREGTSAKGIKKAAESIGLTCKTLFSGNKIINEDYPLPLIAHIKRDAVENKSGNIEHYIVIYKIKKNKILIGDPADSILWIDLKTFFNWWTGVFFLLSPSSTFEKTNDDKSFFQRFWYLLLQNKMLAIETFIASFFLTLLGILCAFYFRYLIDEVIYSYLPQALISVSLAYLVVIIFQAILNYSRSHLILFFSNKIEAKLSLEYFNHILHLPLDFFTKRKSGEILSRFGDISTIKNALSGMTIGVILDCVMLLFDGIVLFTFSTSLLSIAIIPVILSAILVLSFAPHFRKMIYRRSIIEAEKYSHFVESVNGISTIKALSTENDSYDKAELKIIEAIESGFRLSKLGIFQNTLQNFLTQAGNLSVYWYGTYLIMQGKLSLGELIAFVTLLGYFLGPLGRLITLQPQIQEISVASKRLGEILDLQDEKNMNNGTISVEHTKGNITINNLNFSYGTRGKTLQDINLEINEGEKVAFVGPSGSGKTTLMKLLLKFYSAESGDIFLDGKNIKDLDTTSYRNVFGYVPQEILLFSGTIEENIAWGNYDATPEAIFNAAKDAEALEFISKLESRFAEKVGERGASLSGGERQRIALARILLRKPKILVLDEATSSLDSISEASIMNTIDKVSAKTTTLIVAHRLSTIKKCDRIFVLKEGRLVESGTHKALLRKKGVYARMWNSQNSQEN